MIVKSHGREAPAYQEYAAAWLADPGCLAPLDAETEQKYLGGAQ